MGLLDDAIREHLELKRKSGGDPDEVARLENEALGPAVRETPPALDAEGTAEPAVAAQAPPAEPVASVPEPAPEQPVAHDKPVPVSPPDAATPPHGDPVAQPTQVFDTDHEFPEDTATAPPPAVPAEPPPTQPHPAPPPPEPAAPPAPPQPEPPAQAAPPAAPAGDDDDPFAGDEPFADKPAEEHDVLEETPEFLQETPEHDRLWFEQKPPRDFDFDG
jgi:hypothetical protein